MYFDVNSLYAYAMSQSLPIGNYEWVVVSTRMVNEILNTSKDSSVGYMLEVDINYPSKLHNLHNDYPFLCEKMKVGTSKVDKLILNLDDKKNYILHYLTLQMAIAQGLELKKVHKILKFKQSKWLKSFIDFNTEKRKNAKNDFEKKLYKLFSNSIYGKTIENVRKHRNVKLHSKWEGRYGAKVNIAKPNFKRAIIFNENLVAVESYKDEIKLNKPIGIGVCILELSKLKMYDFHYNFMLKNYSPEQCKITYTDTDSFIYHLNGRNIYDVIRENPDHFDTSDYPQNNVFGIQQHNKKVYGVMKDEANGNILTKFVGLRSKMYCYQIQNGRVSKRAKGVKRNILKSKISLQDYIDCLFNEQCVVHNQSTIKSSKHTLFSVCSKKKMLDPFDDKRYISNNKIDTMAWGHYSLKNLLEESEKS